jgi:DNA primase
LNFAKKAGGRRLILAEGYMDVVALSMAGFDNAVAALGTSLSKEHANLIKRYADEAVIAYDSDEAGRGALQKTSNLLSETGVAVRIINLSGAKDPDEYIKKYGGLRFKQLIDNSDGVLDFELKKCEAGLDVNADADRAEYLKRCVGVLANVSSPIEREVYLSKIAAENSFNKQILSKQVAEAINQRKRNKENRKWGEIHAASAAGAANAGGKRERNAAFHSKEVKAERGIIAYLAENPREADNISSRLTRAHFSDDFHAAVYEKLLSGIKENAGFDVMSLQSELTADEMGGLTEIIINGGAVNNDANVIEDLIDILQRRGDDAVNVGDLSDDDFRKRIENMNRRG